MYYWNQDNFKGLKEIGDLYSSKGSYKHFADYCILKEKGLRKQALKAIEDFIELTKGRTKQEQRQIAEEIITLSYDHREIHQLIPRPLHQFLIMIFKNWVEEEETNDSPHRWLGYLCRNLANYEKALEINPTDEVSLTELISAYLSSVDYQTHHLSESLFIGEIEKAKDSLRKVFKLIKSLREGPRKDNIAETCQYYDSLIEAWEAYNREQTRLSFPAWCESKGKVFGLWNVTYYQK